ncbi:MAG: hypothetical protein QOJ84_727 [Bradyrhizobium sp.]|nr:hypothetical protein [Bradyrhizobium sp.]
MKLRIAVIVACAGTFALAQTGLAQAANTGAAESTSAVKIADVGSPPAIRLAFKLTVNGDVDQSSGRAANNKVGTGKSKKATSNTYRMGGGGGGKGAVQRDNEPPRGVGSGGRKAATCCSPHVTNAAGRCICPPGTVQQGGR